MFKKKKVMVITVLAIAVIAFAVLAAGNVSFNFENLGGGFNSSPQTNADGPNWRVCIESITNHGVGAVFMSDKHTRGSALYTYDKNTTGWREPKDYRSNVNDGDVIYWRMRRDNSYTKPFSCSGEFEP